MDCSRGMACIRGQTGRSMMGRGAGGKGRGKGSCGLLMVVLLKVSGKTTRMLVRLGSPIRQAKSLP